MGKRKVYIVGIGMGTEDSLTITAKKIIEASDIVIGAQRMLDLPLLDRKDKFNAYMPDEIAKYLNEHMEYKKPCILVSGDVGFYSGAKKLVKELNNDEVELIPGISSVLYFSSKVQLSWDDCDILSMHGRKSNIIAHIIRKKKVFAILSGPEELYKLGEKIAEYNLENITIHIGENLSYSDERILSIKPEEISNYEYGKLLVVIIENKTPKTKSYYEIPDEEFIRGNVPMTKSEVRTVCIGKLNMEENSVLYDVGAGTGSVSIQAALNYPDSQVIAIERKKEAVELIEQNKKHFSVDNLTVVEGLAPEALDNLIKPTHVFIGGSAGNLREILKCVWGKNPEVRIVITAIALETIAEVTELLKEFHIEDAQVVQISVAKANKVAAFHLMMAQNPITIFSFQKKYED